MTNLEITMSRIKMDSNMSKKENQDKQGSYVSVLLPYHSSELC